MALTCITHGREAGSAAQPRAASRAAPADRYRAAACPAQRRRPGCGLTCGAAVTHPRMRLFQGQAVKFDHVEQRHYRVERELR